MKEKLDQKESHNYDVKESNKQKIKIGQVNKTEEKRYCEGQNMNEWFWI